MIWLFQQYEGITYGYFPQEKEFNVIEFRKEGWRLTRNEARPEVGHWWEELPLEKVDSMGGLRALIQIVFENPKDIKDKWI